MKILKGKANWIDIANPTKKDIDYLKDLHGFHPIILDELLQSSARSRVEFYDDYLYLTYHLPVYDAKLKTSRRAEIDFLITRDSVITIHYENLEALDSFEGIMNSSAEFRDRALEKSTLVLAYYILQSVISFSLRQLRHIEENIRSVSLQIFKGREHHLLEKISYIKRDLLDYHIISKPQHILLESLRKVGLEFWGKTSEIYLDDLVGDYLKVQQRIENFLEVTASLEETNAQILNAKINRSMQTFTILAFFTFPLVLFTSVYTIENRSPEFWTGFSVVGLITVALSFILLRKRNSF